MPSFFGIGGVEFRQHLKAGAAGVGVHQYVGIDKLNPDGVRHESTEFCPWFPGGVRFGPDQEIVAWHGRPRIVCHQLADRVSAITPVIDWLRKAA